MSSPIYPWATCFFSRNEEVRNVTSGVLVDCLSGGGGGDSGGNQQKKQKVARIYFHCVPVSFVLILRPPASLSPGGTQRNACDWLPEHLHHTPACNPQIPGSLLGILKFPKAHPSRRLPAVQPHHTGCVSLVSLRRET